MYNLANKNYCYGYALPPANARRYSHLCGPEAKGFKPIVWRPRQVPKKDVMFKPDQEPVNDY
jgi:hypothetical protein